MTDAGAIDALGATKDRGWIAVVAVGVAAGAAATWFAWGGRDFCLDDAWIHLVYARSLRAGDGFSYNPGDWETGSSSPLWVALLALFPVADAPLAIAKSLGVALHAGTAMLAYSLAVVLARRLQRPTASARAAGLVAGLGVALQPTLLQASGSGMEVSLASAALLACARIAWAERVPVWSALVVGACAVWARPEALFFLSVLCVGAWRLAPRGRLALFVFGGALAALVAWVGYCLSVSGHPWPNTRYVKAKGGDVEGLVYVLAQVLPWQPWLVGLGGAALAGVATLRAARARQWAVLTLIGAWLVTLVAIALGRRLDAQVFFYLSRYFDVVAAVPIVVVGVGFSCTRRALGVGALAPVALVSALQIAQLHDRARAQEDDIRVLHTEPARFMASTLPAHAVVIVEGAGAARFFTRRTVTLVDMLGLNDRALAHAKDDRARACSLIARHPTHVLVPDRYLAPMAALFDLRPLRAFVDERNAQTAAFAPRRVVLAEVAGVRAPWPTPCAKGVGTR